MYNIIINAVQALPEGGKIQIKGENTILKAAEEEHLPLTEGEYVKISISDEGPGILQNILRKIFDLFFTTKLEGSGLGLAASYSMMRSIRSKLHFLGNYSFYSAPNTL